MERKRTVDGKEVLQYMVAVPDEHGIVHVTRVPNDDGTFSEHRAFYGWGGPRTQRVEKKDKPGEFEMIPLNPTAQQKLDSVSRARAIFENMNDDQIAACARKARQPGVSGRRQNAVD